MFRALSKVLPAMAVAAFVPATALAQDADSLSQQLANPLASLISVPIQSNFDFGYGLDGDGFAYTANIQPVIPFSLSEDWNLISRTILPIGYRDYFPGDDVFGLGDVTASLFVSPNDAVPGGLIWGAGPVFLLPTATDEFLGLEKWGLGVTGVALVQQGAWTVGALANHVWSVAGADDREDVSASFVQPFISYNLGRGTSVALSSETSYDWLGEQWTVPIIFGVSQVFQAGGQAMSFQIGGKYFVETPAGGPEWGLRSTITFLFPSQR